MIDLDFLGWRPLGEAYSEMPVFVTGAPRRLKDFTKLRADLGVPSGALRPWFIRSFGRLCFLGANPRGEAASAKRFRPCTADSEAVQEDVPGERPHKKNMRSGANFRAAAETPAAPVDHHHDERHSSCGVVDHLV